LVKGTIWAMLVIVCGASAAWGMKVLEHRVRTGEFGRTPPAFRVALADTPMWLPPSVHARICRELAPEGMTFYSRNLVRRVHALAERHPWIREVHVVRKQETSDPNLGLVEVQATFRQPVVAVRFERQTYFVDHDGVLLRDGRAYATPTGAVQYYEVPRLVVDPIDGTTDDKYCLANANQVPDRGVQVGRIHYILIDGVLNAPPRPGERWAGEDLQAGIRLARLLHSRRYWREVTWIDVSNYGWRVTPRTRREPQLKFCAQEGKSRPTIVEFGRFPDAGGDWVVHPDRKIDNLDQFVRRHAGQLAGEARTIDLRGDNLTYDPY
jgi:hypothetical protein